MTTVYFQQYKPDVQTTNDFEASFYFKLYAQSTRKILQM
jgi:hypothetical protein